MCLKNCNAKTDRLNEYQIFHFSSTNTTVERVKELFKLLKLDYLNEEEQIAMENICAKFSDIFHMPGDKLYVTNLYRESVQLKENTPSIYIKPYRLPRSQKDETNRDK